MDYLPINMPLKDQEHHGDHCMVDIGRDDVSTFALRALGPAEDSRHRLVHPHHIDIDSE